MSATSDISLRFAVIGMNHNHILSQIDHPLRAGAEMVAYFAPDAEPTILADFRRLYPQAIQAESVDAILEDERIQLVVAAPIPDERAALGIRVMQYGKDYLCDKPGVTTLEELGEVRRVQAQTGRIYSVFFSELFDSPAALKAFELIASGAIGRVVHIDGFGPHKISTVPRPDWFWQHERTGGVLNDLACHQIVQFLYFTGSKSAQVVSARVANFNHPEHPELEDFGELMLQSEAATGYIRVDWLTPEGLASWGDARLFVIGTEGYLELRKTIDIVGQPGQNHIFLVNQTGTQRLDTKGVVLPYGRQMVNDVLHRTESAMPQAMTFLACELALEAEARAERLGYLRRQPDAPTG